jgi:hypothetical protein
MVAMEMRKNTNGDVVVFMAFSFIWDEYVVMDSIGCWLNVWQGSC